MKLAKRYSALHSMNAEAAGRHDYCLIYRALRWSVWTLMHLGKEYESL